MKEPFSFYGAYMQYAPYEKNSHLVNPVIERFKLN